MKLVLAIIGLSALTNAVSAEEKLVWEENFDTLDESVWEHFVTGWRGGNEEFQYYRNDRKNSYTKDGILYIKPTFTADEYGEAFLESGQIDLRPEGCTDEMNVNGGCIISAGTDIVNPIQSAKLRTKYSFDFKYGRVEIRAQQPKGDWLWPSTWLLPTDEVYGPWPRSGEIDFMESKGNEDIICFNETDGHQKVGQTLRWGPNADQNAYGRTNWNNINLTNPYGDEFHLFGLEWSDQGLVLKIDGVETGSVFPGDGGFWGYGHYDTVPDLDEDNIWESGNNVAPFDQEFYFVFNLATGGNFFPDTCINANGDKPWTYWSPTAMRDFWAARDQWGPTWRDEEIALKVDYIRVWQNVTQV